jgi:hypothetical protein
MRTDSRSTPKRLYKVPFWKRQLNPRIGPILYRFPEFDY